MLGLGHMPCHARARPDPPTTPAHHHITPCSFITGFVTIFATVIAITKDLPDIEGDRKFGIDTFATRMGVRCGEGGGARAPACRRTPRGAGWRPCPPPPSHLPPYHTTTPSLAQKHCIPGDGPAAGQLCHRRVPGAALPGSLLARGHGWRPRPAGRTACVPHRQAGRSRVQPAGHQGVRKPGAGGKRHHARGRCWGSGSPTVCGGHAVPAPPTHSYSHTHTLLAPPTLPQDYYAAIWLNFYCEYLLLPFLGAR